MTSTVSTGEIAIRPDKEFHSTAKPTTLVQEDEIKTIQSIYDVRSNVSKIQNMPDSLKSQIYNSLFEAERLINTHIGRRAVHMQRIKERMQTK